MTRRGHTLLVVVLLLTSGLVGSTPAAVGAESGDEDVVPREVVVKLVDAVDLPAIAAAHRLDPTPLGRFGAQPIFRLRILDGQDPRNRAAELIGDRRVVYAEPNYMGAAPHDRQDVSWASGLNAGDTL